MLASSRWLQRVDEHSSKLESQVPQAPTAPDATSATIPQLIPCPDTVPRKATCRRDSRRSWRGGKSSQKWGEALSWRRISCPGAEGEDKAHCWTPAPDPTGSPTCPWKKEVRGGLSPPGNLLLSQCFSKRMNAQTVHHWLCCTFPFSPLTSLDSNLITKH